MTEKAQSANVALTGPELSQICTLIEEHSAIHFGQVHHAHIQNQVRKHMAARKLAHASDFLRLLRDSGLEYEEFLEGLLRQESWFQRHPSVCAVLEKRVLREIHQKKFWETPRS